MLRTIAFASYFFPLMASTSMLFLPLALVRFVGGREASGDFVRILTGAWARHVLWAVGARVTVTQQGPSPRERILCVVSNHQGFADIPIAVGFVPRKVGFIAKQELARIPVMSWWMRAMDCVFLKRTSAQHALAVIRRAVDRMKHGRAMIVFPEGTRSRSRRMGSFKAGSMKLPKDAGAAVLPVTIDGTYRVFEEEGNIRPADITVTLHRVVPAETVRRLSRRELAELLQQRIARPLRGDG
jgi:1-acyl-sn-glycerol-3-phosphate acyltransferase